MRHGEKRRTIAGVRIRTASLADEDFVREIAGEVFSIYGDYRRLLPGWLRAPEVLSWISEDGAQRRTGYVMLAFFREGNALVGDVLAIAVAPGFQDRGIGRRLLMHAITTCEQLAGYSAVRAVRLSVAASNARARHLFESCGFREVPGDFGSYAGGQRALHLERAIGGRSAGGGPGSPGGGTTREEPGA